MPRSNYILDTGGTPRLVSTLERVPIHSVGAGYATHTNWVARVSLQAFPQSHPFSSIQDTTKVILTSTEDFGDIFASVCGSEPDATVTCALKDFRQ